MSVSDLYQRWGREYADGEIIFREGDEGDFLCIIQEGKVEILKRIGNQDYHLATLGKGEFFGEMAIVRLTRRVATARALGAVKVLVFDRQGFQQMIETNSKLGMAFIDRLCQRLDRTNSQLVQLAQLNVQTAIYAYVNTFYQSQSEGELTMGKMLDELSLNLQIPADLIRCHLEQLHARNILRIEGGKVTFIDSNGLVQLLRSRLEEGQCVES